MTDKQEQSAVEKLVRDPKWSFIEKIATEMIQSWRGKTLPRSTSWELTKEALLREGKAEGLTKFLQRLNETANKNNN